MLNVVHNYLIKLKNAQMARMPKIKTPYSSFFVNILSILYVEGLIRGFKKLDNNIIVYLKYDETNLPLIKNIKQISKPGRKFFCSKEFVITLHLYSGTFIISNPNEKLVSNNTIRLNKKYYGGELLWKIN